MSKKIIIKILQSKNSPTSSKNILKKAKYDNLTHQIIHSPKWTAIVGPYPISYYRPVNDNLVDIYSWLEDSLQIINKNIPDNELRANINTLFSSISKNSIKYIDGLPPELIDTHLPKATQYLPKQTHK